MVGRYFLLVIVGLAVCSPALQAAEQIKDTRPNIIVILTDDQGYGDLSATGNPVLKTPNLDKLYAEGVRFTDFHVSPTCAPTRSALLTGRHEFRNGVTHTINERERLTLDAITLPQVLKQKGYATGIFGKWHLGDEADHQPGKRGFDEVFIHGAGGIGQTYVGSCGDAPGNSYFNPAILHNGVFEKTKGYCTDVFFDRATRWIDATRGRQPFFAWIATNAPHEPLQVRSEDEALYAGKVPVKSAKFFGMIANIDDNVGKLMLRLAEWKLDRETLIVVMNDNGGTNGVPVYNAGMRGQKVTPWLGGTRAFSIWHWPAKLKPHDVKQTAAHLDVFPTIAEIAGAALDVKVKAQVEGRSLVPLLENQPSVDWPERTLVTHVGRWARGKAAESKYLKCSLRRGPWHLVCTTPDGRKKWQLFNVETDPEEKVDVAGDHPNVIAQFDAFYDDWWTKTLPMMINESADGNGPKLNPFKELYWKQFGGGPDNP